ncbi:MAG: class II fructose-bisphosphate aldolase [Thermaceae bacterium]|nr:class II fructose-bisphosphate aldolase [Thermaceae bacterium]
MALVTSKEILVPARQKGYGVGAFNCVNLEYVRAVLDTAVALHSPVIIAVTPGAAKYSGWVGFPAAIRAMAQAASVPVCLHLDHGSSTEEVEKALRAGFTSVMIDASHLPLGENIALTRRVVEMAHAAGVSVEGELGEIGGQEEHVESAGVLTDPEAVPGFVEATGLDVLAASFGSVHQKAARDAVLDLERLERIARATFLPLVLHGGSGVPFPTVQQAIARGVAKINVGTELQRTFTRTLRETLSAHPAEWDVRKLLGPSVKALGQAVRERLEVFGSVDQA